MPVIVMALVGWLISALRQYLPGIIGRVLLALGIGFMTHQVAIPSLIAMVQAMVGQLPGAVNAYFYALGFDVVISIILSAVAAGRAQAAILTRIGSGT